MLTMKNEDVMVGTIDGQLVWMFKDNSGREFENNECFCRMTITTKDTAKKFVDGFITAYQEKRSFSLSDDDGEILCAWSEDTHYIWDRKWTILNVPTGKRITIADLKLMNILLALAEASVHVVES